MSKYRQNLGEHATPPLSADVSPEGAAAMIQRASASALNPGDHPANRSDALSVVAQIAAKHAEQPGVADQAFSTLEKVVTDPAAGATVGMKATALRVMPELTGDKPELAKKGVAAVEKAIEEPGLQWEASKSLCRFAKQHPDKVGADVLRIAKDNSAKPEVSKNSDGQLSVAAYFIGANASDPKLVDGSRRTLLAIAQQDGPHAAAAEQQAQGVAHVQARQQQDSKRGLSAAAP
ncbi:MAG: hypothetical protein WDO70_08170 [Alphaproteobacteria bacterium]